MLNFPANITRYDHSNRQFKQKKIYRKINLNIKINGYSSSFKKIEIKYLTNKKPTLFYEHLNCFGKKKLTVKAGTCSDLQTHISLV